VTDAERLGRYAADRGEAAVELSVWRHGRVVPGVCRRVRGNEHAAADAFRATFLVPRKGKCAANSPRRKFSSAVSVRPVFSGHYTVARRHAEDG
jgi:hypothetical protein